MATQNTQFFAGMNVADSEGARVGELVRYDERLGYLETRGTFSGARYIPFTAIQSISPDKIHLNVSKDVVSLMYKRMPAATPQLSSGKPTGGATVESGYNQARRLPLDAEELRLLRGQVREGTVVFDEFDERVGTVEAYDATTGYMRLDPGTLVSKPVFLPATAVSYLDDRGIHLSVPKGSIEAQYTIVPGVAKDFFARQRPDLR
ncbi:MAG: hypothetical protein ABUS79_06890 [Pseudomonadota bacterium]